MNKKKIISMVISMAVISSCLTACKEAEKAEIVESSSLVNESSESSTLAVAENNTVSFTDSLDHEISITDPKNVVVCSGSFAEVWLLAGGELAGVTQDAYDDHLFTVPETTENLGEMKAPSVEQIIAMNSNMVILSSKIAEHVKLYDVLKNAGITPVYFDVVNFDDYLKMLKICTDITGKPDLYEKNGTSVRTQIDSAIKKVDGKEKPTVLYIRAFSTGAKAKGIDTVAGAILADLGCINIVDENPSLLEDLSMEEIIRLDPDFIFVTTMGESTEDALDALKKGVQSNPAWSELSAVKNDRYIVLQKDLFHYKPNARWGESYEVLADILYGE